MVKRAENQSKCTLKGTFVTPCTMLRDALEGTHSAMTSGIGCYIGTSRTSGASTRRVYTLRSGAYRKEGIILNFCPFCGTDHMPAQACLLAAEKDR